MGICLDTSANGSQDIGDQENEWKRAHDVSNAIQSVFTNQEIANMQNAGKIKFDPPKVPVIFVLGGPGSGKVTHCDTFMQERRGVAHINMMDLLQQFAMGNDLQDFSQLSSKTVTEVLMLEMKMAPAAKAYLISGYPRSMRDVVEYSEKIQVVNGVILISWRQSVLQKQIDYGAKLGHVVLSLAKMELENFFKNVMPVADYFDQSDMLIAVNGERAPLEVYKDFRIAVLDKLSALENQEAVLNGITGMGRGMNDIPGSIVSVETAPSQAKNITENEATYNEGITSININPTNVASIYNSANSHDDISNEMEQGISQKRQTNGDLTPFIIWVIGGPGSNKSSLCVRAVSQNLGWGHISMGLLLRTITDSAPRANTESYTVKEALTAGELAPEKVISSLLEVNIRKMNDKEGIIIDGYPRNFQQVQHFELKYKQTPPIVLLDCSKLQLGRGRIDDTVSSFRRRLEIFREHTLPMLKSMDNKARLQIIDGDTDSPSVQREFEKVIRRHIQNFNLTSQNNIHNTIPKSMNETLANVDTNDAILHDLENNVPGVVPTISHHVSLMNGNLKNVNRSDHNTRSIPISSKLNVNGELPRQSMIFKHMLEEAEKYPVDSYM